MNATADDGRQSVGDLVQGAAGRVGSGPTVLRIGLGSELRRRREEAGITREHAAHLIRASAAKISRMEGGRVGFKQRDISDLLTLYEVTDEAVRSEFFDLARRANEPGWWHKSYANLLPSWFETYLGLEQAASVIRTYDILYVPELLQIREYAHAVIKLAWTRGPIDREAGIGRRVELRMRRQELLTQPNPPKLWAVIDEAALWRWVVDPPELGRELALAQLAHLLEVIEKWPNICIQVAPLAGASHAAGGAPFTIFRFNVRYMPDVVYQGQLTGAVYLDKPRDVDHYRIVMSRLAATLAPPEMTPVILSRIYDYMIGLGPFAVPTGADAWEAKQEPPT